MSADPIARVDLPSGLAASGALRGAVALAGLVGGDPAAGRPFTPAPEALARYAAGVLFEVGGALEGAVAVLFAAEARRALLRALGRVAQADPDSALCEVANVVASQAVCAIADGLGARVTLSVPRLAERGAARALAASGRPLASELRAAGGEVRALLVLVPGAAPAVCDTVGG